MQNLCRVLCIVCIVFCFPLLFMYIQVSMVNSQRSKGKRQKAKVNSQQAMVNRQKARGKRQEAMVNSQQSIGNSQWSTGKRQQAKGKSQKSIGNRQQYIVRSLRSEFGVSGQRSFSRTESRHGCLVPSSRQCDFSVRLFFLSLFAAQKRVPPLQMPNFAT